MQKGGDWKSKKVRFNRKISKKVPEKSSRKKFAKKLPQKINVLPSSERSSRFLFLKGSISAKRGMAFQAIAKLKLKLTRT